MASLTSVLPHLPNFGLSVPALYERQRALVRLGHLPAPKGRGRGSGAEATPRNVALLIIAVMATDNLSDTDRRITRLANAKPNQDIYKTGCDLTGAISFIDALTSVLAPDREFIGRVEALIVSRSNLSASLFYRLPKQRLTLATVFGPDIMREFDVYCRISGEMLASVRKILSEDFNNGGT